MDARRPALTIVDIRTPPTHTDEGLVAARQLGREHPDGGVLPLSHHTLNPPTACACSNSAPDGAGHVLKDRTLHII